ncbi:MAG: hypothetical protein ACOVLB_04165 [Candidatus Nanopelagicus sp.]
MNPTITNIPIAVSENPVVIDLPDGQKLVLGRLNAGSVIEVATWRGTGRPDSRTNRLMLGMTDASAVAAAANAQPEEIKKSKKLSLQFGSISLPNLGGLLVKVKSAKQMLQSGIGSVKKAIEKSKELTPVETTADLDINAWIENISREVEVKGAQRRASAPKKSSAAKKSVKKKR